MAKVLAAGGSSVRVVSDGVISHRVYDSLARHRVTRTWWLRDWRGMMVDVGPAVPGRERFDRTLSLGRGEYVLGCGPALSGGVREFVRVGEAWVREASHPDGHCLLSDYAGGLSMASDELCLVVCLSRDRFECLDCGKLYVVRGHAAAACRTPERHESCRPPAVGLACGVGSEVFWNGEVKMVAGSLSDVKREYTAGETIGRRESTRSGGARA